MRSLFPSLAALAILNASCSTLSTLGSPPALFGNAADSQKFDFESDKPSEAPDGFETRLGHWSVADSPTAVSGHQVLVRHGDSAGLLEVKSTGGSQRIRGEVAVRIFLGSSGAGIGCEGGGAGGYFWKVEPNQGRVVLYRRAEDSLREVAKQAAPITKGSWTRLGILCEPDRVVGYLDGKPVASERASLGAIDLALYADPGVTAQFDELKIAARK